MSMTPTPIPTPFQQERDALLPKDGYVILPAHEETGEAERYLKIPRLNMRRTLRLSQWLDTVGSRESVQHGIQDMMGAMTGGLDENGNPLIDSTGGIKYILTINKFISSLALDEALELFSIITAQPHDWLDEHWEPGWGIQAIRVAFQQQGFANLFGSTTGDSSTDAGAAATEGNSEGVVSVGHSTLSNPNTGGQTTPY